MTREDASLRNGVDFCLVEVTFTNGPQYGITAFGVEAKERYSIATGVRSSEISYGDGIPALAV